MDVRDMVVEYLGGLQQRGVLRQPVDEAARAILHDWCVYARDRKRQPAAAPAAVPMPATAAVPMPATAAVPMPATAAAQPYPPAPQQTVADGGGMDDFKALKESLGKKTAPKEDEPEVAYFRPGGRNADEAWEAMRLALPKWDPLRNLGTLRETPVFGEGNRRADIMMVGDVPGYQEEKAGRPMQGPAGEKLDGMLKAMGISRGDVYLTTLVKFRPAQPRQTVSTRAATQREVRACLPVLDFEIGLVQPKVIVAFGVVVARALLRGGDLPLSDYQGRPNRYNGVPVVVTHHPSYLLRTSDLAERRRLWEEMLRVMEMVGLPISDKQRGFFLPKR